MTGYEQYKKVVLGCDHAGFDMKEKIKFFLNNKGLKIEDREKKYRNPIHYVQTAHKICREVVKDKSIIGVLVCGTGIGMSIAANKIKNIQAAVLYNDFVAEYARRHNDANILVFGARTMDLKTVESRINIFLSHQFEGGKYAKRNSFLEQTGSKLY